MGELVHLADFRKFKDVFNDYVMDALTERISFAKGTLALYTAGYMTVRELYEADPADLLKVPGIGHKRLAKIQQYFASNGICYPKNESGQPDSLTVRPHQAGHSERPRADTSVGCP